MNVYATEYKEDYGKAVELIDVEAGYKDIPVLKNVNLSVDLGRKIAIMGRSGTGKTTLLKVIAGLLKPWRGEVKIFDEDIYLNGRRLDGKIAYIPQNIGLIGGETVLYNVLMAKASRKPVNFLTGIWDKEDIRRAKEILDSVGLGDKILERVDRLSGGEGQRVAIARAMFQEAGVILADEPVSNLDFDTAEKILEILTKLSEEGVSIIAIMHDRHLAVKYFDEIYVMEDGSLVRRA